MKYLGADPPVAANSAPTVSRKWNTSGFVLSHRKSIQRWSGVIKPPTMAQQQGQNVMRRYVGLEDDVLNIMKSLPSFWTCPGLKQFGDNGESNAVSLHTGSIELLPPQRPA